MSPAQQLAEAYRVVEETVAKEAGNDKSRMAYLVARAALLSVRREKGEAAAFEMAASLSDEMIGGAK